MFKKKLFFFAVILLLVFGLLTYQSTKGESRFIDFPLYPLKILEQGTSAVIQTIRNIVNTYIFFTGKEDRIRELNITISELEKQLNTYVEEDLENRRLRELLNLKSERTDFITAAEVFARDPANWFQILWINKGADSRIAKDMIAVTPVGPIGRVHRVLYNKASIILITDVNSAVAVRLQSSRIEGILSGRGTNKCYMKYVSKEAEVNPGELIVTSGLDGIYPEGLLIGMVTNVIKEGGEMYQIIEADPVQDLHKVEEVAILRR